MHGYYFDTNDDDDSLITLAQRSKKPLSLQLRILLLLRVSWNTVTKDNRQIDFNDT